MSRRLQPHLVRCLLPSEITTLKQQHFVQLLELPIPECSQESLVLDLVREDSIWCLLPLCLKFVFCLFLFWLMLSIERLVSCVENHFKIG